MKSILGRRTLALVLVAIHTAALAGVFYESEWSSEFSAIFWLPLIVVDLPALFAADFLGFSGAVGQVSPWVTLIAGGIQWYLVGRGIQAVFLLIVGRHRKR